MTTEMLSAATVAIIARTARSSKQRTALEAYTLLKRCDHRLKQLSTGVAVLAPDVRLTQRQVVALLWTARKTALAQWKAAKAARVQGTLANHAALAYSDAAAEERVQRAEEAYEQALDDAAFCASFALPA